MVSQVQDGQKMAKRVEVAQKWMQSEIVWVDSLRQIVEKLPSNDKAYVDRLLVKGQSRQIELGLRVNDWRVCNQLEEELRGLGYQVELGNRSQVNKAGYDYSGTLTIVIPREKAVPGAGMPKAPATAPASAPARPMVVAAETTSASPVVGGPQTRPAGGSQTQPGRPNDVQAAR